MKITFSNLGSIKKTTLDLRPLTVIIGPNNSNKTYIAYSIYGLLKNLTGTVTGELLAQVGYDLGILDFIAEEVGRLYKIDSNDDYFYEINDAFLSAYLEDCRRLVEGFERNINFFFQDSDRNLFKNTKLEVNFTKRDIIKCLKIIIKNNVNPIFKAYEYSLKKNIFYSRYVNNALIKKDEPNNYVPNALSYDLRSFLYPNPFLLPAERNALIITYKILENRRYNLLKNTDWLNHQRTLGFEEINSLQKRNPRYPQPIEDFLTFLTNLELDKGLEITNFAQFADVIEKDLQQNNKTKYVPNELDGKEIKISVKKGLDIDLYNASSSIKQLAPLLLYLRYRARENDLLIIDEPEMNLHPESQAKLLEVLGMLVNAGVNVLLTTHSPYFMSHLNNLVSGKTNDESVLKEQAKSLYLGDERAFLKMEDVSAYEMKNNKLKDLKDKDYGIRWDTLSDVSADIQQKFFEIYEKGKETSAEDEV